MAKNKFLLFALIIEIMIILLLTAFLLSDGGSTCNQEGHTGGAGEWIVDPGDLLFPESCWYLHTIPEFESGYYNCIACHDGIQAHDWSE